MCKYLANCHFTIHHGTLVTQEIGSQYRTVMFLPDQPFDTSHCLRMPNLSQDLNYIGKMRRILEGIGASLRLYAGTPTENLYTSMKLILKPFKKKQKTLETPRPGL